MIKVTETRNNNSMNIDQISTCKILEIINREDGKVIEAVQNEIKNISSVIDLIAQKMKKGGRLFYIGAGTSGRLGVLDAVECIPTFSMEPGRVVGILAGGEKAMFVAQENIEDNLLMGVREVEKYDMGVLDSIVGIAASGDTPFVVGALQEAKKRGTSTFGLVCNHNSQIEKEVELTIKPIVGPEVLTGSTRMKAGTAQKIVLNMISTTVMIKMGKVYSNLMVDLKATNKKLRERARDIFMTVTNESYQLATEYLSKADYSVKPAIIMYELGIDKDSAEKLLKKAGGILRNVLEKKNV